MKIAYWVSTILLVVIFCFTGFMELTHNPMIAHNFQLMGYPPFIMDILGIAKVFCIIALLYPGFPTLKEWAYAGATFLLIGATWSHIEAHQAPTLPLGALVFLICSYLLWHRLRAAPAVSVNP